MRDLTKSMMSFSWAMSMFGMKQMLDLLNPQNMGRAATSFEEVTRSTESQLGSVTRSTFQAGDRLQRGMIDMAFSLLGWGSWNPNEMMRMGTDAVQRTAQASMDVMQQSAQAMGQAMPGRGGSGWNGSSQQRGWGGSGAQQGGGWGGSGAQQGGGWGSSGVPGGDWGASGAQQGGGRGGFGAQQGGGWASGSSAGTEDQSSGWGPMPQQDCGCQNR
ncbi:MAG TPA: hypothetical protein VKM72_36015 [Thermoanaerobaculia bacterium]|nr:hypothetical protein [Thermoanaerobaculia bacterium]